MEHLSKTSLVVLVASMAMTMLTLLMVVLVEVLKKHQLSHQARLQTQTRLKQLSNNH
jgi:hypothetical protein